MRDGGQTSVCAGYSYPYAVAVVPGTLTYTWTAPTTQPIAGQGTKTVVITYDANSSASNQTISVKATNNCGISNRRLLSGISISNSCVIRTANTFADNNVTIYPNPAHSSVTLAFNAINENDLAPHPKCSKQLISLA